ncbi:MAG: DUF58 domain-containing protein [Pseudomonadota bacterium]
MSTRSADKRRKLTFTKQGKYFIALTLGIGFAAINTGNNLLYMILCLMLTTIIGSGVLSELILAGLRVDRELPKRIFANKPFLMGIGISNDKSHISSFSIEIEDLLDDKPLGKKCFFLKVAVGDTQKTSYRHCLNRRGLYAFTGFRLSTRFPFSLFCKSRKETRICDVSVFPEIHPVHSTAEHTSGIGEQSFAKLNRHGEFFALREYRETDDPRDIHWRKSAHVGLPLIRQYHAPFGQQLTIFLDNQRESQTPSPLELERQEQAVSQAASLAVHFVNHGFAVGLVSRTIQVNHGSGQNHLDSILRALATIEFTPKGNPFLFPISKGINPILVNSHGETHVAFFPSRSPQNHHWAQSKA